MAGEDGKHSRHNLGNSDNRINRSAKHRYVFFVGTKAQKGNLAHAIELRNPTLPERRIKK